MIGPGHQDLRKSSKFVNQFSYCFEQDYLRLFRLKTRWVCIERYRFLLFINWRWEISARAKREVLVSKAERYCFLSLINLLLRVHEEDESSYNIHKLIWVSKLSGWKHYKTHPDLPRLIIFTRQAQHGQRTDYTTVTAAAPAASL